MSDSSKSSEDRLRRAIEAFVAHRARPTVSDAAFLARHADLEDLLAPMLRPDDSVPGAGGTVGTAGTAGTQTYLGDFRLIREIGRGGMGVVYEADQVSLGRRVALKVLQAHLTLTPRQIERFRREAAAAAKLRHPGIIPIHGVGEDAGNHFFAMDYVEGESLNDVIHRVEDDTDPVDGITAKLGVLPHASYAAEIAEIGAQIAEALQFAHSGGIIHRDIKPQNLLLGLDHRVRIVDFGLALDRDRNSLTKTGEFAGTPYYTSPEQALASSAEVDGRTDVFSLGVVLYEMLTLHRPFEGNTTAEVLHCIKTREAKSLRRFNRRVPRDLEIICLKAMEKDRDSRYATAGAMADDLRRFLRLEPIEAQPPGPARRLVKLVRRRKAVAVSALLGGLMVLGVPLAYGLYQAELGKRDRQALLRSVQSVRDIMHLVDEVDLSDMPGKGKLYRKQIEKAVRFFEELLATEPDNPKWIDQAQAIHQYAAQLYLRLGSFELSAAASTRRVTLLERLRRHTPDDTDLIRLSAAAHNDRHLARREFGRSDASLEDLRLAEGLCEAAMARTPAGEAHDQARIQLAVVLVNRAYALIRQPASLDVAEAAIERALAIWKDIPPALIARLRLRIKPMVAHTAHGSLLRMTGRPTEAIASFEAALEIAEKFSSGFEGEFKSELQRRQQQADCYREMAMAQWDLSQLQQAAKLFGRSLAIRTELGRVFPHSTSVLHNLAVIRLTYGRFLVQTRHFEEAAKLLRSAKKTAESLIAQRPDSVPYALLLAGADDGLGLALRGVSTATADERRAAHELAVERLRALVAEHPDAILAHHMLGGALSNLAHWHRALPDLDRTRELASQAIAHQKIAVAANPKSKRYRDFLRQHHATLSECLTQLGDHDGAARIAQEMVAAHVGDPGTMGLAALYTSAAAGLVLADEDIAIAERHRRASDYCDRAMAWLQRMRDLKFFKPLRALEYTPQFAPLRERADYRALVAEIAKTSR